MSSVKIDLSMISRQPQYQGPTDYQLYAVATIGAFFGLATASADIIGSLHPTSLRTMPKLNRIIDTSVICGIHIGEIQIREIKDQFQLLAIIAIKFGLYDAADYLRRKVEFARA